MNLRKMIVTVDSHTAGMATRTIIGGLPTIPGENMMQKRQYVIDHLDSTVNMLLNEPRGHSGMLGTIITAPCSNAADVGVIFLGDDYILSCGHSIIGVVTMMIETGMLNNSGAVREVIVDTPGGVFEAQARVDDQKVTSVTMKSEPAFLCDSSVCVKLSELGRIELDIAFCGSFFAIVRAMDVGLDIAPANSGRFLEIAACIRKTVNQQIHVVHPEKPHINQVKLVQFTGSPRQSQAHGKNVVVSPPRLVDRSPCGTGTGARMAQMFTKGQLSLQEPFVYESIIGTSFTGRLVDETKVGPYRGVIPEITGRAHITGIHQFMLGSGDPLEMGFLLD